MENYTDQVESGKPEERASVETRASENVGQYFNRAPLHDVSSRRDLKWRRERTDDVLYCGRRLVPDATYPGMWRVAYPDGEFGDRKNLTWARHEGARVALSLLNERTLPGTRQRSPLTAMVGTGHLGTKANSGARQSLSEAEDASATRQTASSVKQDRNNA
jgi:hypothetical protein